MGKMGPYDGSAQSAIRANKKRKLAAAIARRPII